MKEHTVSKLLSCSGAFAAVAAFDYFTGYEVSSFPVYLIPIFLAYFNFGKKGGCLACVLAVLLWGVVDRIDGHRLARETAGYWNGLGRLVTYALFVYGLSIYTRTIAVYRQRLENARRLIAMCHCCGKILWKGETWKTPEQILELTNNEILECPECSESSRA